MRQKIRALVVAAALGIGIAGVLAAPAGASPGDTPASNLNGYWNGTGAAGCHPQGFNWNPLGGNPEAGQWAGWGNPPGGSVSFYCAPGQPFH